MRTGGYPCWLFSAAGSMLIKSEAEYNALEGEWFESPADVPAVIEQVDAHAMLLERAAAAGVAVDRRWGEKRLLAEVEAAEAKAVIAGDTETPDEAA